MARKGERMRIVTLTAEDERMIGEKYVAGATMKQISSEYHIGNHRIGEILRRLNVPITRSKLHPFQKKTGVETKRINIRAQIMQYCKDHNITATSEAPIKELIKQYNCNADYVRLVIRDYIKQDAPTVNLDDICLTKNNMNRFKQTVSVGDRFMIPVKVYVGTDRVGRKMMDLEIKAIYPNFVQTERGAVLWGDLYNYQRVAG